MKIDFFRKIEEWPCFSARIHPIELKLSSPDRRKCLGCLLFLFENMMYCWFLPESTKIPVFRNNMIFWRFMRILLELWCFYSNRKRINMSHRTASENFQSVMNFALLIEIYLPWTFYSFLINRFLNALEREGRFPTVRKK